MAWTISALREYLSLSKPGSIWRLLAIVFALLNLKSLPFGWHVRLFRGLFAHVHKFRHLPPKPHPPKSLFQPTIITSRTSLWEMDYNFHKSNSTYFSDLDVGRMHHVACLLKLGLFRAHFNKPEPGKPVAPGSGIYLGGVMCLFRKETKPYEGFEIWTRVLAWDRKWLYLVSHVVKKGVVKPESYTLQPWRKGAKAREEKQEEGVVANGEVKEKAVTIHPAIFATSIAKYVFKQGRITVPPEVALMNSELLPPRPEGLETPAVSETPLVSGTPPTGDKVVAKEALEALLEMNPEELIGGPENQDGAWTWAEMEVERTKGMLIAQHFAELDGLFGAFSGDTGPALGRY